MTKLSATRQRFDLASRSEPKIPCPDIDRRQVRFPRRSDRTAVRPARTGEPILDSPLNIIEQCLYVLLTKPRKHQFTNVCFTVAIGILEIPNVGRGRDKTSAVPQRQPRRPR